MSKDKIGTIAGHDILVDSGEDYTKILLEAVKAKINHKKVKAGQVFMMPFDFGEYLVAEIHIKKWKDK